MTADVVSNISNYNFCFIIIVQIGKINKKLEFLYYNCFTIQGAKNEKLRRPETLNIGNSKVELSIQSKIKNM